MVAEKAPSAGRKSKLDFGFSEEQEMLRDAAKRFLADNCSTKFVRQMMADETAHDQDFWQKLVGQGWPGLLIPEQYGGANGTFLDMTVVVEEMGKAMIPGPFFAAALMGAAALYRGRLRRAQERVSSEDCRGQVHRYPGACRGSRPLRRGRCRAQGNQEGGGLYAKW